MFFKVLKILINGITIDIDAVSVVTIFVISSTGSRAAISFPVNLFLVRSEHCYATMFNSICC